MITADGWFDWMEHMPAPLSKLWPETNALLGVFFHSAVGSFAGVTNIVMGTLPRSVHGVVGYGGQARQFYPITASCWAQGAPTNHYANRSFLAFEFEGGVDEPATVSEPLTPAQVAVAARILVDVAAYKGVALDFWHRPAGPTDVDASLYEHREVIRFGGNSTACPSGRITWDAILAQLAPTPPQPAPRPEAIDIEWAKDSLGHFLRMGWQLRDLSDQDVASLQWCLDQARPRAGATLYGFRRPAGETPDDHYAGLGVTR